MLSPRAAVAVLLGLSTCVGGYSQMPQPASDAASPDGTAPAPQPVPAEDVRAVVDGNNAFAIELYKKLAEKTDGNIVVSPYSVSSALAMTYAGARGKTAAEMARVLGLTGLGDRAHAAHAALARALRDDGGKGGPEFHVANALWGQRGLPFRDEFLRLTRDHYGAGLREVNFAADADGARRTINEWVDGQTRGKIPELVKPHQLTSACVLVLTNALYFRGDWAHPFDKRHTRDELFHRTPTDTVTLPTMNLSASLKYADAGRVRVLELPYAGGEYAMVIALPVNSSETNDLPGLVAGRVVGGLLSSEASRPVRVSLPKFRVRVGTELRPALERLGMAALFSDAADLSRLTAAGGLRASAVLHETWIDVDERGTEAAAATAVQVGKGRVTPAEFRADRPFAFAVIHRPTNLLLIAGRFCGERPG